jgi:hypothetical protein
LAARGRRRGAVPHPDPGFLQRPWQRHSDQICLNQLLPHFERESTQRRPQLIDLTARHVPPPRHQRHPCPGRKRLAHDLQLIIRRPAPPPLTPDQNLRPHPPDPQATTIRTSLRTQLRRSGSRAEGGPQRRLHFVVWHWRRALSSRRCGWAGSSRAGCRPPGSAIPSRSVASSSNTRGGSRVRWQRMLGSVQRGAQGETCVSTGMGHKPLISKNLALWSPFHYFLAWLWRRGLSSRWCG